MSSPQYHGFQVILEKDMREHGAATIAAIKQIKGVLRVIPMEATFESSMAEERARQELGSKIIAVIYPKS